MEIVLLGDSEVTYSAMLCKLQKGLHIVLTDNRTWKMCSLAHFSSSPHMDTGCPVCTAISLAIWLQLIDIITFFISARFPACSNTRITTETEKAPLSQWYHIYKQLLKWIILQMADLIYSILILLVPISEGDIFQLCPLKHK